LPHKAFSFIFLFWSHFCPSLRPPT
jgi:hypothetical protein